MRDLLDWYQGVRCLCVMEAQDLSVRSWWRPNRRVKKNTVRARKACLSPSMFAKFLRGGVGCPVQSGLSIAAASLAGHTWFLHLPQQVKKNEAPGHLIYTDLSHLNRNHRDMHILKIHLFMGFLKQFIDSLDWPQTMVLPTQPLECRDSRRAPVLVMRFASQHSPLNLNLES